jgi:hypothetical protein
MSVPLIEQGKGVDSSGGTAQVTTTGTDSTAASTAAANGPSVAFSFSDGSQVVLGVEDLQVYLAAIQTLLLLYVAYREVTG